MDNAQVSEPADTGSDSEWEYEYAANETEVYAFYFQDEEASKRKKRPRRKRNQSPEPENPDEVPEQTEQQENEEQENDANGEQPQETPAKESTYQLMNLHTKSPLLSYNGRIYRCNWATTLGTDMIFLKRGEEQAEDAEEHRKVLHAFNNWDLVACSGARLVASEAILKYKGSKVNDGGSIQNASNATTSTPSFLRRLVEVQARKGEIDAESPMFADDQPSATDRPAENQNYRPVNALIGEDLPTLDASASFTPARKKPGRKRKTTVPVGEGT